MNFSVEGLQTSHYIFLVENKFQNKNLNKKSYLQLGALMVKLLLLAVLMEQYPLD